MKKIDNADVIYRKVGLTTEALVLATAFDIEFASIDLFNDDFMVSFDREDGVGLSVRIPSSSTFNYSTKLMVDQIKKFLDYEKREPWND